MDFGKVRDYLFLGLLGVVSLAFLLIIKPFFYPIFWAAILAALFHPVFLRINRFFKHENLSALLTLLLVIGSIIIPFLVIGTLLVKESINLYASIGDSNVLTNALSKIATLIQHNPVTAGLNIDQTFWTQKFQDLGKGTADFVFKSLGSLTQNSLDFLVMFAIMLYALFFFIRDGARMLRKVMYLLPLGDRYEVMLYNKFVQAASSIIKGTVIIGGVQGFFGGVAFSLAGVDGALIWGIIMVLFSLVPGVGSALIWFPAGVIELLLGNTWSGVVILVIGFFLISTIDNILRPMLVGKKLKLPSLLILLSTLGGIFVFGPSGFMIGPIVAALFMAFWEMYQEYFERDLEKN